MAGPTRADPLAHLAADIEALKAADLYRHPAEAIDAEALSFCSNDYLGLAHLPAPPLASGAGASRLIAGERAEHRALERALAKWLGTEEALLFSSGYAANVGTIAALAAAGDLVVSDALNHASLIDGARLSRARVAVVAHNDVEAVRRVLRERSERRAWVVVESYYSMDADGADLAALRETCTEFGAALVLDEAHALGVLGRCGRGRAAEAGVIPDVLVGTLGKAFGAQGAFVAGRSSLRAWLWNRARSFVFSTGLAPASAGAALRSLGLIVEGDVGRARVRVLSARIRAGLERIGVRGQDAALDRTGEGVRLLGFGHVVPLVVGDAARALTLAAALRQRGIAVQAVRPPTVPVGTSRIRLTVTARHDEAQVDRAVAAIDDVLATSAP